MKHYCHYHPNTAAKWLCTHCQTEYCVACMPDADTHRRHGHCPHCGQTLRYLGAGTEVEPFWNRIPQFFRYPFHSDPLLVIGICTFVPLMLQANLIGLIVSLVLLLALFKYTYAVINHTTEGHMTPPPLATAFTGSGFGIVILQWLVFILMGGLVYSAGMVGGPILALAAMAFVVLVLPASVMILAMEREVGPAVNPINLVSLISRIGWPYFVLYLHLILMMLASSAVQEFAFSNFAPMLAQPLSGFISSTFMLIFFHMMGYLLFQYQEELGFASDFQDETPAPAQDRSRRLEADIDMHVKDGQYDRALAVLKSAVKSNPPHPQRVEQLYRLLTATNNAEELMRHHRILLLWLGDRHEGTAIAGLLKTLTGRDPAFRLDDPELIVHCARALHSQGENREVLKLMQDFHKRFPDSEHIATGYLTVAQSLAQLGLWEKATAFLNFIKQRCAQHPLHGKIDAYLEQARNQQPLRGPAASFDVGE
ncbi:DUF4013 domain-containing protein [Marinobacter bohaiensis]|uniref:DUF4013 domain-containing protein n=1 Tax=Marinobacter bohaiensis TaxID=2201898 RepID=UPI001D176065|nr:DUF4013 domain-containing protein [Marinobacter bohaiensis]